MAIVGPGGAGSADEAIRGGADLVQVRARDLGSRDLTSLVRGVIAQTGAAGRVIVNSRPDIAEITGAKGVHLPESGLDVKEVRRVFPGLSVSVSRHDRVGLERARDEGADFAILGPVFPTPGKEDRALGLFRLRELLHGIGLPVLVVGGMSPVNAADAVRAGASGVVAIRPFAIESTARSTAADFRLALDN